MSLENKSTFKRNVDTNRHKQVNNGNKSFTGSKSPYAFNASMAAPVEMNEKSQSSVSSSSSSKDLKVSKFIVTKFVHMLNLNICIF